MKTNILISLYFALSLCAEVYADGEQEVRRGLFPYMAFLYYPDETVVDGSGARFLRGAVLIRPDWLVTSAVGSSIITDSTDGFPRKTLLARVGAVAIDANFTLNEDEDEQEREIIQIIRPYNHSATQWWRTDISLMKTLLPFNITSAVGPTSLNPRGEYIEKTCIILVYTKRDGNWTEDRNLIQLTVELLPPSIQNCGSHFIASTMTCATDSDENKNAVYDPNFCQGNSGGPLICEGDVVGIQTYIDNDCKPPHLYQLLSAWDNFITCGTEDKCQEEQCSNICDVANKDPPVTTTTDTTTSHLMHATTNIVTSTSAIPETTQEEIDLTTTGSPTLTTVTDEIVPTEIPTTTHEPKTSHSSSEVETSETKSWPHERYSDTRKKAEQGDIENMERKPSVEAQQQNTKIKARSAGRSNVSNFLTLFFGFFILACLI